MRAAILAKLSGDTALMGTLTGGMHTATEISRQTTPAAFDASGELCPCGLLRLETSTPFGPFEHSQRLYFVVMLYQRSGCDSIEAARSRVYALLHKTCVSPTAGACWEIEHANDVLDVRDEALACSLALSRFVATYRRQ